MRSLNLDQLRALVEVIEQRSFSAAARRLNLTQPAVSLQGRELERRFGVQLVERLGRQAHATLPGRELIVAAQRIFRECQDADATMRQFRDGWIGRVHIGTLMTARRDDAPAFWERSAAALPPFLSKISLESAGRRNSGTSGATVAGQGR